MQARQLRRARGEPTDPSTPPAYARPYRLCPALPLMRGAVPGLTAYVRYPALPSTASLMCSARGALLCLRAVRCLRVVLCFTFDSPRGASTGPAYLLCVVRCSAYLRQPLALLRQPPGCLRALPGGALLTFDSPRLCALLCLALLRHPPGVLLMRGALLCLLCFACFVLLALFCLRACLRVSYTY